MTSCVLALRWQISLSCLFFLLPSAGYGIGYEFCDEALAKMQGVITEAEHGDNPEEIRRYRDRQVRLSIVRQEERKNTANAMLLGSFEEKYKAWVARVLKSLQKPQSKAKFLAALVDENRRLEQDGTKDLPVHNLVLALQDPKTTDDVLLSRIQDYAFEQAGFAMSDKVFRDVEGVYDHIKDWNHIFLDLGESTAHAREARELANLSAEVYAASQLRLKFHEHFVRAAPLSESFKTAAEKGL
ncbi:hypothetical protein K2X33_13695, partial [bacterium]|nr:hypothetical protein [bacterium]